ncbi:MAG: TRAP transporter small permease [Desulfobacterales bacterium]
MLTRITKTLTRILLAMGAAVLAMMMFLTATDVILRYLLNRPLSGAFELVEYMMAILIPFSVVYCADQKSHVAVELVLGRFSKKVRNFFGLATTLATLLFVLVMAWQNVLYIGEMYRSRMTSAVLLIPTYPFVAATAIGISAFALVLLSDWLDLLSEVKKS